MEVLKTILIVLQVIMSVAMVVIILLQSGKEAGLSGALSGNNETYMSKSGSGNLDKKLAAATKWVALVWGVFTLVVCLL